MSVCSTGQALQDFTMFARAPTLKLSIPKVQPVQNTATGISALSIWMKDTERYRYAAFPSHSVPACAHCQ